VNEEALAHWGAVVPKKVPSGLCVALEFSVKNNLEEIMNFQNRINIIRKTSDISNKYDAS
jgi:hypothetical protein